MAIQKVAPARNKKPTKSPYRVLWFIVLGFIILAGIWKINQKTNLLSKASHKVKNSSSALLNKTTSSIKNSNSTELVGGKEDWPEYAQEADFGWGSIPEGSQLVQHKAYTLCYNEEAEQAWWVSYSIDRQQVQDIAARRDNFFADELVKTGSASPKDYSHSGYDRGHLAPCDDFKSTQDICDETFAMSNMTPQPHVFNAGRWKTLEEYVNRRAHYGKTMVITTGPIFDNKESQIQKIGLNEVWVPKACYKILFSGVKGTPKMIAFVMNNTALPKGALTQWATTVDNIEKQTGIDFFASMPDDVENKLEGQLDITGWFAK